MLSSLRQCCQQKISLWPCYQPLPGLFLDLFVRMPLASYGAFEQSQRWTPMASYGTEWVNIAVNSMVRTISDYLQRRRGLFHGEYPEISFPQIGRGLFVISCQTSVFLSVNYHTDLLTEFSVLSFFLLHLSSFLASFHVSLMYFSSLSFIVTLAGGVLVYLWVYCKHCTL